MSSIVLESSRISSSSMMQRHAFFYLSLAQGTTDDEMEEDEPAVNDSNNGFQGSVTISLFRYRHAWLWTADSLSSDVKGEG